VAQKGTISVAFFNFSLSLVIVQPDRATLPFIKNVYAVEDRGAASGPGNPGTLYNVIRVSINRQVREIHS
jgi:hypothetical protein